MLDFVCQHDAACRVIARLKKERDEARALLAQAERQIPINAPAGVPVNASVISNGKRGILVFISEELFFTFGICSLLENPCT